MHSPQTPTRRSPSHFSSPSLSSSPWGMSLHHLGISSPLSPFRRQLSPVLRRSPSDGHTSSSGKGEDRQPAPDPDSDEDDIDEDGVEDGKDEDESIDELTQDSRDVLVERLTDLAQRLARGSDGGRVANSNISALHAKVDEMERVFAAGERANRSRPTSFISATSKRSDHDPSWGPALSASWVLKKHLLDMAEPTNPVKTAEGENKPVQEEMVVVPPEEAAQMIAALRPPMKSKVSSDVVQKMVNEAELLCQELSAVVKNLQDRREESDARSTRGDVIESRIAN
jgi:hypothetical protein